MTTAITTQAGPVTETTFDGLIHVGNIERALANATTPQEKVAVSDMAFRSAEVAKRVGIARLAIIEVVELGCRARDEAADMLGPPPGKGVGGGMTGQRITGRGKLPVDW